MDPRGPVSFSSSHPVRAYPLPPDGAEVGSTRDPVLPSLSPDLIVHGSDAPLAPTVLRLGFLLLVGAPIALVLWHNVSELLAGRPHPGGLLLSALLLPVAVLVVRGVARTARTLGGTD